MSQGESLFPSPSREFAEERRRLAPGTAAALRAFSQKVFADGALPAKTKQLIAVAVAHVTQCLYCIKGHTKAARQHGATPRRSWRRSGSRPRCAPVEHGRTRHWPLRSLASGPRRAIPAAARMAKPHCVALKRVYAPASPDDGRRVLVERLWPRGLRKAEAGVDLWPKEIAPSHALRRWFHEAPDARWPVFQ